MTDCSIQRITDLSSWECVGDSLTATWMDNFNFLDATTCNLEFSAARWNASYLTVNSLSGGWENIRTTVNATSADYNNTYTQVNTLSSYWSGPISLIYPCPFVDVVGREDTLIDFLTVNFPNSSFSPDIEFIIFWPQWNITDDYTPTLETYTTGCVKDICDTAASDVFVNGIAQFTFKNTNNIWVLQ